MKFDDPKFNLMAEYPVQFCMPVFFGPSPDYVTKPSLSNGTGFIVRIGRNVLGVTCYHVLQAYREQRATLASSRFNFGPFMIDPDDYVIDEDPALDLATFDFATVALSETDLKGAKFVEPRDWPPGPVGNQDVLAFAGLPGVWRKHAGRLHLEFHSFSSGATGVDSLSDKHLVTQIYMEDTLAVFKDGFAKASLGGMSGGPVFAWRTSVRDAELVGVIYEYQEDLDLLCIRRTSCIEENGSLRR